MNLTFQLSYSDPGLQDLAARMAAITQANPEIGDTLLRSFFDNSAVIERGTRNVTNKFRELESITFIKNTMYLEFPGIVIQDHTLSRMSHTGDLTVIDSVSSEHFNEQPLHVMIEVKNYSGDIPREEYEKFTSDFVSNDTKYDSAMFISCGPGRVPGKEKYTISWHKGHQPMICISDAITSPELIATSMHFIVNVISFNRRRMDFVESFSISQFLEDQHLLLIGMTDSIQNEITTLRRLISMKETQLKRIFLEIKGIDFIVMNTPTDAHKISRVIGMLNQYRKINGHYPATVADLHDLHPFIKSVLRQCKVNKQDLYKQADTAWGAPASPVTGSVIVPDVITPKEVPAALLTQYTPSDISATDQDVADLVSMAETRQRYMDPTVQQGLLETLGHKKATRILDSVSVVSKLPATPDTPSPVVCDIDPPARLKFKYLNAAKQPGFEQQFIPLLNTQAGRTEFGSLFGNSALKYELRRRGFLSIK